MNSQGTDAEATEGHPDFNNFSSTSRNKEFSEPNAHRESFPREMRVLVAFACGYCALLLLWSLLRPGSSTLFRTIDDLGQACGPLFILLYAAYSALRSRRIALADGEIGTGRRSPAITLMFLGVLVYCAGQLSFTYTDLRSSSSPQFGLSDIFYLVAHPLLIVGILKLPSRRLHVSARTRIFLDGLVTMTAAVTFTWYFLVGPILMSAQSTTVEKLVAAFYPLADLVFMYCLIALMSRSVDREMGPALSVLFFAWTVAIATNSAYSYQTINHVYRTGSPLDVGWPFAMMLLAIGAQAARGALSRVAAKPASEADTLAPLPAWRSIAPYALVPAVGALMCYVAFRHGNTALKAGVYVGAVTLIALTLLRQVFAILENSHLYQSLQSMYGELAKQNRKTREHAEQVERLNDELRTMQNELVQSAKLASLGTLSAGVAHELNQPLAIIRGIMQQLCQLGDLDEDLVADLRLVEGQTGRMMKIIQHLRMFSRAGSHEFVQVDMHKVLDECFILVGAQLKAHNIRVTFDLAENAPTVMGEANEIEQVFLNVLTNARDALEQYAEQSSHATNDAFEVKEIKIRSYSADGSFVMEFEDNGPGIPPEIAEHVFDPFFTTKDPGKGTGLGLSISHSIIRKHYGTIHVENVGQLDDSGSHGAKFVLALPIAEESSASAEAGRSGNELDGATFSDAATDLSLPVAA